MLSVVHLVVVIVGNDQKCTECEHARHALLSGDVRLKEETVPSLK